MSFDVFDTLVFRPFTDPTDVFSLVEVELDRPGFRIHRIRAEKEARQDARERSGGHSYEITFREIYEKLHVIDGIDIELGMATELEVEKRHIQPNPYMVEILYALIGIGKKVVFTSDMYLPSSQIRELLQAAGINADVPIFVSNEHGSSKRLGGLYRAVETHFRAEHPDCTFAHIGDNWIPDVVSARQGGWLAVHYPNIHHHAPAPWTHQGEYLRSHAAQGMIDVKFANIESPRGESGINYYALGYRYSGPMVMAFARWLADHAQEQQHDQMVFLARDGYLPALALRELEPNLDTIYLPWSRAVGLNSAAKDFKAEWIRQFVRRAGEAGYQNIAELLHSLGLAIDDSLLEQYGLSPHSRLSDEHSQDLTIASSSLEKLFAEQWDILCVEIENAFESVRRAAATYVTGRNIGIVDVGWAGTGTFTLRSLFPNRHVSGYQFGTFRYQRFGPLIEDGLIQSFAFGQDKNFDLRNAQSRNGLVNNTLLEILLGAPHPSISDLRLEGATPRASAREPHVAEDRRTREITLGAMDFVYDFTAEFAQYDRLARISGATVGSLYSSLLSDRDVVSRVISDFPSKIGPTAHQVRRSK